MTRTSLMWYSLVAVLIFGPVGVRMATWPGHKTRVVDLDQAARGKVLFTHEWTSHDPLSSGGDGLGPVFNANSCVACHHQGGVGGSGGLKHNVTTFVVGGGNGRRGMIHAEATQPIYQETLANIDPNLPRISQPDLFSILPQGLHSARRFERGEEKPVRLVIPAGVDISQRKTPALFGARLIDELPDKVFIAQERAQKLRWGVGADSETVPVGRAFIHKNRKVGRFGWKSQSPSLIDFVEAACANELGLSNPGQPQPVPLGMPGYRSNGTDLTTEQCEQIASFISSLSQPRQQMPANPRDAERVENGLKHFKSVGCADCHVPSLGSIQGIYSDLLLHRMGNDLRSFSNVYYGAPVEAASPGNDAVPDEWRTPPLWGVADAAPYLHDGRAATLEDAIRSHGGQAQKSAQQFQRLTGGERNELIAFLSSLKAPQ